MKQRNLFLFLISMLWFMPSCTELTEPAIDQLVTELEPLPTYQFKGTHYFGSYYGCDYAALTHAIHLTAYFVKAVDKSDATLLHIMPHKFDNGAMTIVAVLSESHASIHTYPEHGAVFVDLFTCGDGCDWREFERVLKSYLKPVRMRRRVRSRR